MSTKAIVYMVTILIALIAQMVYFLIDDRTENHTPRDLWLKKWWHWAGGAIHIWVSCAMSEIAHDWRVGLLTGSLTWYFFDGFVNSFVLNKEWWNIGTTAWLDIAQRYISGKLHIEPRLFSALLKHLVVITSIVLLILK